MDLDELGALLAACEEEAGVWSSCSSMVGSAPWASSTICAKFLLIWGTSIWDPLCMLLHKPHP